MTTKQEKMYERIAAHGRKLLALFPAARERDPVQLCKKLRALEVRAGAIALRLCNGPEYPGGPDAVDVLTDGILAQVNKLLGNDLVDFQGNPSVPIFVNRDPRGYALKIDADWVRGKQGFGALESDWGGYGLIAPDFKEGWAS